MIQPRKARKRKRPSVARRRRVPADMPSEDPDDAAAFIAEMLASMVLMARRQRLDVLTHLLSMAQLEAEEHLRLRSKRKLS